MVLEERITVLRVNVQITKVNDTNLQHYHKFHSHCPTNSLSLNPWRRPVGSSSLLQNDKLQNESHIMFEALTAIEIYTPCFAEAKNVARKECEDCNMSVKSDDDLYLLWENCPWQIWGWMIQLKPK